MQKQKLHKSRKAGVSLLTSNFTVGSNQNVLHYSKQIGLGFIHGSFFNLCCSNKRVKNTQGLTFELSHFSLLNETNKKKRCVTGDKPEHESFFTTTTRKNEGYIRIHECSDLAALIYCLPVLEG